MPRKPPSRLKWLELAAPDGKRPWRWWLVEQCVLKGEAVDGYTDWETRQVFLDASNPHPLICLTSAHELLHSCVPDGHGDEVGTAGAEKFITEAEAGLWHFMTLLGARFPPFPRGYPALRARAIAAKAERKKKGAA